MQPLPPLRLLLVTEERIASAAILDHVFAGLHQQGAWEYQARYERDCPHAEIGEAIRAADVVVFLRCTQPVEVELFETAKRLGRATVYCVDDDFDALDPSKPLAQFYARPEMAAARGRMMREADLVWVFTPEMAHRLAERCGRLHVGRLPSFVEERAWDLHSIEDYEVDPATITIGYAGPYRVHSPDVDVVVAPLLEIVETGDPPIRVEFIEGAPGALSRHPRVTVRPYFRDLHEYYRYVRTAGWSLGLAPLRDTRENRAKTNNKYREYAALGVPGIYSDMPVYSSVVRHGETGYLAPHTEAGMLEALRTMVSDGALRRTIRRNALIDAATTYALLPMQQEWLREITLLASRDSDRCRLLVVGYDGATTTHVDALSAAKTLEDSGKLRFQYVQPGDVQREHVRSADLVFVVRAFQPETLRVLEWAESAQVTLVSAWDDDFYALSDGTALARYHAEPTVRVAMDRFLRECSLVAASTPPLAERSRRYNENVVEAIYGFDTGQLPMLPVTPPAERAAERVRIGFFGLQWTVPAPGVIEAIRRTKRRLGDRVCFEIVSACPVSAESADLFDWQQSGGMDWAESLRVLRSRCWDVGLAPLAQTEFNASKQATKFRDYAWAGMAMICSRVPAYERVIIDGVHGLLVENSAEAWEGAMMRLVDDASLRESLRRGARELFAQAHTLDATIGTWHQLLWRVARARSPERAAATRGRGEAARAVRRASRVQRAAALRASPPLSVPRHYRVVPEADAWQALDVLLGLHQRPAEGRLILSIYAGPHDPIPVRRVVGNLAEAADNAPFRFTFPAIANSCHRPMRLKLELEGAGVDTTVSLYEREHAPRSFVRRVLDKISYAPGELWCEMHFGNGDCLTDSASPAHPELRA
jgi:glycosyltransferase involved in cell wall biosynthesis